MKWYAEFCECGINVSYDSLGGSAFEFLAFDTKAERDKWVENHEWDHYPDCCAAAVSRKTMESVIGKEFILVPSRRDNVKYECVSKDTPVFF